MAYGDIGAVIETLEFADENILRPQIVHVSGNIYAIACAVADGDGWIYTVEVDAAGVIPATVEASAEFEAETANGIFFTHIAGNTFAVLTRIDYTELRLRTISISDDGLTIANIATRAVGAPNSDYFSMCLARGSIYAVAYSEAGTSDGFVKTFTIDPDGTISAELDDFEFDTTAGDFCVIVNVSDGVCAIAYAQSGTTKLVTTVAITALGAITDIAGGPLTITTASSWTSLGFCRVLGDVFAVAFQDATLNGWIMSILIDEDGVMADPGKADLEFDATSAYAPYIIAIGLSLCALVYKGPNDDGFICTFAIDAAGNITEPTTHNLEFDDADGWTPHIVHVAGDTYAIAYVGVGIDGWVCSLGIETPPPPPTEIVHHEMLLGIGP